MHHPDDRRYAETHEWAKVEADGAVRVGISDYAQDQLGDVVYVELPEPGSTLAAGEVFGEVESTKSVSEVYAPVGGVVMEVNAALPGTPEVINTDPYGEGWFILIRPADAGEIGRLLDAAAYTASIS